MPRRKGTKGAIPLIKQDRVCIICGQVFHSSLRSQRACGRECGNILKSLVLAGRKRERECSLSWQERCQAVKLLYCLKKAVKSRPDLKPDLNYARLKEAWQELKDVPLRIGGGRYA